MDTTCLFVAVRAAAIERVLRRIGLAAHPVDGAAAGYHPIFIDLGRIVNGAAEAGGLNQHSWWQLAGGAAGLTWLGPAAFWSGAVTGWLRGGVAGAAAGGAAGATYGGILGALSTRSLSATASRWLGTYSELLVAVPNVVSTEGRVRYLFVMAMHTDGAVAVWGDQALGYGFGKTLAHISRRGFESYEVWCRDGKAILHAGLRLAPARAWRQPSKMGGLAGAMNCFSQPLLGHLGDDRFAVSTLERHYAGDLVRVAPASGRLCVGDLLAGVIPPGDHEIAPAGSQRPWGAFSVTGLEVRITYPERRRLRDL